MPSLRIAAGQIGMAVNIKEFAQRLVGSRLISASECQRLFQEYAAGNPAQAASDAIPFAKWLIAQQKLSVEQAKAILSGRMPEKGPATIATAPSAPVPAPQAPTSAVEEELPFDPIGARRSAPAKKSRDWIMPISAAVACLVIVVGGIALYRRGDTLSSTASTSENPIASTPSESSPPEQTAEAVPNKSEPSSEPAANESAADPKRSLEDGVQLVEDDGQTLWAAPEKSEPIALRYLPPGGQVFLVVRPADILAQPEGDKVIAALGPLATLVHDWIASNLGVPPSEVEQLLFVWYPPDDGGEPLMAGVARLQKAISADQLHEKWNSPQSREAEGQQYFAGEKLGYYLPADEGGRVIAIAPIADIPLIIANPDPPLRKEMARLVASSDVARQFTLLATPIYVLEGDGQSLLVGRLAALREPLYWLMGGDQIHALSLGVQLGDDLFIEFRCAGQLEIDAQKLAEQIRGRAKQIPERVESYVATLSPQPYGKAILLRYPQMVQRLEAFTRGGADNQVAVLRCYLPAAAAHNLILGTELALLETSSAASAPTVTTAKSRTASEALQTKVSLVFPKDTLEKSLELLGKEIDLEIVIQGRDLQLEGITKNQSFELTERDHPASEILRNILKKANPDGKLVYVIRRNGDREVLWITTRAAVKREGWALTPDQQ